MIRTIETSRSKAQSAADGLRWEVRTTWRVLLPGVTHPETTSENRWSEWSALLHASWLVRSEGACAAVEIVRIEICDQAADCWRVVHDPRATLDAVAQVAWLQAMGRTTGWSGGLLR